MKKLILFTVLVSSAYAFPKSSPNPTKKLPVLVVVGMKDEIDIATGDENIIIEFSAGYPDELRKKLKKYNASNVRAVVSFGVSGGMDPSWGAGLVVVADQVATTENRWLTDAKIAQRLRAKLAKAGVNVGGGIQGGHDELDDSDPKSREELWKLTGAGAIDMESQVTAEFSEQTKVPLVIIRVVADPSDFTLPPAALIPLDPATGDIDHWGVYWSILQNPWQIPSLIELADYYKVSLDGLKDVRRVADWDSL